MIEKKSVSVAHYNGLNQWAHIIEKDLGFSQVITSIPPGFDPDLFLGSMIIHEFNNGGLKVHVNSSAQKTRLLHTDNVKSVQTKFIILNSCGSLLLRDAQHREIISSGDSILIPAWHSYSEESFSRRNSLSFIFDMDEICSSSIDISPLFWRNVSSFEYGVEINKIISNFYNNYNEEFCEKNVDVLLSLLRLEVESLRTPKSLSITHHDRISYALNFIRANLKNPNIRLSDFAKFLGITERMVQYSLSQENTSFHKLLSAERCFFLASKIKREPKGRLDVFILESGFSSVSSAIRQFKKTFNITPKQYQLKMLAVN